MHPPYRVTSTFTHAEGSYVHRHPDGTLAHPDGQTYPASLTEFFRAAQDVASLLRKENLPYRLTQTIAFIGLDPSP